MMKVLLGDNFSGKSSYLKEITHYQSRPSAGQRSDRIQSSPLELYLGPIPTPHLTGFFGRVRDELFRYRCVAKEEHDVGAVLGSLGREDLLSANPYTLSGGERVLVTALAHALRQPKLLAIDTTLEQLGNDWKFALLAAIRDWDLGEILLSDNRHDELVKLDLNAIEHPRPHGVAMKSFPIASMQACESSEFAQISPSVLRVDGLSFSYTNHEVFSNFSMEIEGGRIYHLKGRNGTGKSTLAKLLCGSLKPKRSSRFEYGGGRVKPHRSRGNLVGYSHQSPDEQLFATSVGSELDYAIRDDRTRQHASTISRIFGLSGLVNLHPFDLPITVRKRLCLAATLANPRPFYVLDEPTLFQDNKTSSSMVAIVKALAGSGAGVVLISHSTSFIAQFDEVTVLNL